MVRRMLHQLVFGGIISRRRNKRAIGQEKAKYKKWGVIQDRDLMVNSGHSEKRDKCAKKHKKKKKSVRAMLKAD